MPKRLLICFLILVCGSVYAEAQTLRFLRQHDMAGWGIPAGNYSGIAPLGRGRYALISDKQQADGWTEVSISFAPDGDVESMRYEGFVAAVLPEPGIAGARDAEGIICRDAPDGQTLYVGAENDQQIIEYTREGVATGRRLDVPEWCSPAAIFGNYGFEALAYDSLRDEVWTTTENSLRADAPSVPQAESPGPAPLRLLRFSAEGRLLGAYAYLKAAPRQARRTRGYVSGVPEMLVVDDSTLLVMEREVVVTQTLLGSRVHHRLYAVRLPSADDEVRYACGAETTLRGRAADAYLPKRLVGEFTTKLRAAGRRDLANYEGMCLGPLTHDGQRTIIFVADSQNRMGNRLFRLKDNIRVAVFSTPPAGM